MKKNVFAKLVLIAAAGFAVNASAATATTTFDVLFKVNKSCSVTATNLNLGEVDATGASVVAGSNGTVTVTCSKKTAYTVNLVPSSNSAVGVGVLAAQNAPWLTHPLTLTPSRTVFIKMPLLPALGAIRLAPAPLRPPARVLPLH